MHIHTYNEPNRYGMTWHDMTRQGEFRPKQSLGQNYLSDQNYVLKICNHFGDTSEGGKRVVELGPGTGALTQVLHERFPDMLAVDIDQRAVEVK